MARTCSITCSASMLASGCFITVSNDGFQRLWNLEGTCIGECLLPNVSEDLQKNKLNVYRSSKWLFRTERLVYNGEQMAIAEELVTKARSLKESTVVTKIS